MYRHLFESSKRLYVIFQVTAASPGSFRSNARSAPFNAGCEHAIMLDAHNRLACPTHSVKAVRQVVYA